MQIMYKKMMTLFLCVCFCVSVAACGGKPQQEEKPPQDTEAADTETVLESTEADSQEPLLDSDATDDDLLEALREDIHVVTDDVYIETVTEMAGNVSGFSGQIYQLEGVFTAEGEEIYVSRTVVDGEERTACGLPLKYLNEEMIKEQGLKEGDWIRVTGIINEGEAAGETAAVLEVLVVERLEEQGAAELQAN